MIEPPTMEVTVDGEPTQRHIDYMEEGRNGLMQEVPVLSNGEEVFRTASGEVIILKTHN